MKIGEISYWYQEIGGIPNYRPPLSGDRKVDVCIIGAGYTGLWTAYYLKKADPKLKIIVIEKEFAGYGASGRNGGWLTGGFAWNFERYGPNVADLVKALKGSVREIIDIAKAEGIDADIHETQELTLATNPAQLTRMQAEIQERHDHGEGDVYALNAEELSKRVNTPALGAMVTPNVASVQPAKLVRGLAKVVEQMGVEIFEKTEVTAFETSIVRTNNGTIRADVILRATEGYTPNFRATHRDFIPLNSAQIITEPLSQEIWDDLKWSGKELIGDFDHIYCYCRPTHDGRIAVGSRGTPYLFGSRTDTDGAPDRATIDGLKTILARHFPQAASSKIDHAWCGVLGVPRDWCASVGFDQQSKIGWAGGYVGVGVSTTNLAARTLADLALNKTTDLTQLPWVNRTPKKWEHEPFRWIGIRAMYGILRYADHQERNQLTPARLAN